MPCIYWLRVIIKYIYLFLEIFFAAKNKLLSISLNYRIFVAQVETISNKVVGLIFKAEICEDLGVILTGITTETQHFPAVFDQMPLLKYPLQHK